MALQATHMRFALDLKNSLDIFDWSKYLSGAVYPDSRYATKVDRLLTHPADFQSNPLYNSTDFYKGWYTHLLYDQILKEYTDNQLKDLLISDNESELFAKYTTLKILQDVNDARSFDVTQTVNLLSCVETPYQEDPKELNNFYDLFKKLYANPQKLTADSHFVFFDAFKVNPKFVDLIRKYLEEFKNKSEVKKFLDLVYPETLKLGVNRL